MATAAAVHHLRAKHAANGGEGEEVGFGARRGENRFKQESGSKILIPEKARKHVELTPEIRVQRAYRQRLYDRNGGRLHRRNLADRLLFESSMLRGTFRLVNQALIFGLMVMAALLGSDVSVKRGIFNNLKDAFQLEDVTGIKNRPDFVDALAQISSQSKDFFILSSKYFDTEEAGFVQLLGPLKSFSAPKLLGGIDLSINAPTVSFTAWVKTEPLFVKGYIMRKRLLPAGYGSELSCWGWYLDRFKGPQFHYGVHDVFPTDVSNTGRARQVEVKLASAPAFEPGEYTLLTVILTQTNVTFWTNLEALGTINIKRPVTDCFNDNEGILLGTSGVTLGQLRFYPKDLTRSDIEEIYQYGSRLSDMASGSEPADAEETGLDAAQRSITGQVLQVKSMVGSRQKSVQTDLILAAVAVEKEDAASYSSPIMPVGDTPSESWDAASSQHTSTVDAVLAGRSYYQVVAGAYHLSVTSSADARYVSNVPDFVGTGDFATFGGSKDWCWTVWFENEGFWSDGGPNAGYRYFDDAVSGLRWKKAGLEKPTQGRELSNQGLASALVSKTEFTQQEWKAFGNMILKEDSTISDLRPGDFIKAGDSYFTPTDAGMENKYKINGDQVWRHMAYQFDEDSDKTRLYMDGIMVFESAHGVPISGADCAGNGKKWSIGHSHPGYTYGGPIEFADLRMYHHGQPLGLLTAAEIMQLSAAPTTGLLDDDYKCLAITDSRLRDQVWQDSYGHDCGWYYGQSAAFPEVCQLAGARKHCPISCKSRQECFFRPAAVTKRYFAWDRTRLLNMQSPNGTVCLGSQLQKSKLVEECIAWRAGNKVDLGQTGVDSAKNPIKLPGHLEGFLETMAVDGVKQPRKTARVNLTICDELDASINEFCDFDIASVREFTKDMKANGGDFTIAFWIKPLGDVSKLGDTGRFFPSVSFLSKVSPPQHNLHIGYWVNPNGEARINTQCFNVQNKNSFWNVEMKAASNDDWTFIAIAHRNKTSAADPLQQTIVYTNLGTNEEYLDGPTCLFDPESMFNAIEVNYPMLLSPIMMVPEMLPSAKIQQEYLENVEEMSVRSGPTVENKVRVSTAVPVDKKDFGPRSTLMAAPIIFQTRVQPTAKCPYTYSSSWVTKQHAKAVGDKCAKPFECDKAIIEDKFSVMACPGDPQEKDMETGYADFLYSIIDNDFVFRPNDAGKDAQGELKDTETFIDSLTQSVQVLLVFFTPKEGLTSVLTISADMSGPSNVEVEFELKHYGILEEDSLTWYLVIQSIVLFNVSIMMFDALFSVISTIRTGAMDMMVIIESITDLMCGTLVIVYIILRFPAQISSAQTVKDILGVLDDIPWASPDVPLVEKKTAFFDNVGLLLEKISWSETLNNLCNAILLVNLLRVIMCTSVHPRLALLTGTISNAMDDLFHTAMLTTILMLCFAGIGTWRFGSEYDNYADFETTLQTEFELLFGEFQDGWTDSREMATFTVLYLLVLFLLVLNFLLAIIVEAYMQLREDIAAKQTEKSFLMDLWNSVYGKIYGSIQGWPSSRLLGAQLSQWEAKLSVGYKELAATEMFRDPQAVGSFIKFYRKYDFCEPIPVNKFGIPPEETNYWLGIGASPGDDSAMMLIRFGELLDRRMTKLIQNRLPMTQKETVQEALSECRDRERVKNGLPPLGQPTNFAKPGPPPTTGEPAAALLQMPRPVGSPYSEATQRSVTGSQAARDMTGRLHYNGMGPLQGAELPASLQVGNKSYSTAQASLAYYGTNGTPRAAPTKAREEEAALNSLAATIRSRRT